MTSTSKKSEPLFYDLWGQPTSGHTLVTGLVPGGRIGRVQLAPTQKMPEPGEVIRVGLVDVQTSTLGVVVGVNNTRRFYRVQIATLERILGRRFLGRDAWERRWKERKR